MNDNEQKPPSIAVFRRLLNEKLNRRPDGAREEENDLLGFMAGYLKEYETKIFEKTGRPITPGSLRAYKQTVRVLKEFKENEYKNREFSFEQIDHSFNSQFQRYMVKANYSTNTIGKHIKTLKTFFLEAKERGLMPGFSPKKLKVLSEQSDAIYLNESEIGALYNLDLTKQPRLEKVRDLFLVGCWTGLRFSDFIRIRRENIDGDFIEITTQKTGEKVVVPIHSQVGTIMKRYEGKTTNSLPEPISNQKMNTYLKELGALAEINQTVSITFTKGGVKQTVSYPKYELITTHSARRSFATNAFLRGFPRSSIMNITGHRTETAFMRYIKITPRDTASNLRELWNREENEKVKPLIRVNGL